MELAQQESEAESTIELDQSRVGRLSRMDALAGAAMSQETARRRKLQLKQIGVALKKIAVGSYGECDECLEFIHTERLSLNPAAPLCIECATKMENKHG